MTTEVEFGQLLEQTERECITAVREYMRTNDQQLRPGAVVGQAMFGAIQRRRQSEGAREALHYAIIRDLAENKEALAEYIRRTLPNHPVVPALPDGMK